MSCVGKIAFVDYSAGLEFGEFFITEETPAAYFGIKLGTTVEKHRLRRLSKNSVTFASVTQVNGDEVANDLSSELFNFSCTPSSKREFGSGTYERADATSDYLDRWVRRREKLREEAEKAITELRDALFAKLR